MRSGKPAVCVYTSDLFQASWWIEVSQSYRVSLAHSLRLLEWSLDVSTNETGDEYVAVILDRSVSASDFLGFLTRVPGTCRGDILRIAEDGSGTLSTCAIRDGRFLYRLDADDVEFYLDARLGIRGFALPEPTSRRRLAMTA